MTPEIKTEELRSLLEQGKLLIGSARTLKALKEGKIKRLIFASTIKENIRYDLVRLAEMGSVPIIELNQTNHELGTACRKKYAISVIGEVA